MTSQTSPLLSSLVSTYSRALNEDVSEVSMNSISLQSYQYNGQPLNSSDVGDYTQDDTPDAISDFVLECRQRQLRQYNLSVLEEATVNLNIGQGADYSVDSSCTTEGETVAVKHLKPTSDAALNARGKVVFARCLRKVLKEVRIMTHPPIAKSRYILSVIGYGWTYAEGSTLLPALVVDYGHRGNLRQYMRRGSTQPETHKWQLLRDVVHGLEILHQCGIFHGDLKLENVLVVETDHEEVVAKIADFGGSGIGTSAEPLCYWGTDIYNPPEIRSTGTSRVAMELQQLKSCDIWAFGLLALEIFLNGECFLIDDMKPSFHQCGMENVAKACLQRVGDTLPNDTPGKPNLIALLTGCLKIDASQRLMACQLEDLLWKDIKQVRMRTCSQNFLLDCSKSHQIIDLTHSMTLTTILKGRTTSTFSPEKLPWSVQAELARQYERLASSEDCPLSGLAHMNLAICFCLGFGVERNGKSVAKHAHAAALRTLSEAQFLVYPLFDFLNASLVTNNVDVDCEGMKELKAWIEARAEQNYYHRPITELQRLHFREQDIQHIKSRDLHALVSNAELEASKALIESDVTDFRNDKGETALLLACRKGDFASAELLLTRAKSDPSLADETGITPLHLLFMFEDDEIDLLCKLITHATCSISSFIETASTAALSLPAFWVELLGTPLQWAVMAARTKAVSAVLNLGADPNNKAGGLSPMQIASSLCLADIISILMTSTKFLPSTTNEEHGLFYLNESHPFRQILIHGQRLPTAIHDTIEMLSPLGEINLLTSWGDTPVKKTALCNYSMIDEMVVKEMLKKCDVSIEGSRFSTIQSGIMGCNSAPFESLAEITLMLIDAGFSVLKISARDTSWPGWNAMHWAVANRSLKVVRRLHHTNRELLRITTESENQETPMHIAAQSSYGLDMIKLLLNLGADPLAESGLGYTPFLNCIGEFRLFIDLQKFDILVEASAANGYVVSSNGMTVLHYVCIRAAKLDQEDLPGYELLDHVLAQPRLRSLVNQKDTQGWTPLHLVCCRPDYSAVKRLVEAGADINCMSPGPSPMSPIGLVLEHARVPAKGWANRDLSASWPNFAYRTACYLSDQMVGSPHDKKLSRLHIAAYCCYVEEIRRLVEDGASVNCRNARGYTPAEMLAGLISRLYQSNLELDPGYDQRAAQVLVYLEQHRG